MLSRAAVACVLLPKIGSEKNRTAVVKSCSEQSQPEVCSSRGGFMRQMRVRSWCCSCSCLSRKAFTADLARGVLHCEACQVVSSDRKATFLRHRIAGNTCVLSVFRNHRHDQLLDYRTSCPVQQYNCSSTYSFMRDSCQWREKDSA